MASFQTSFVLFTFEVGQKKSLSNRFCGRRYPEDKNSKFSFTKIEDVDGNLFGVCLTSLPTGLLKGRKSKERASILTSDLAHGDHTLLVFNVADHSSFVELMSEVDEHLLPGVEKALIGMFDLADQRMVSKEEAENFAASQGMQYFEVLAKDRESIRAPFRSLLKTRFEKREGMTSLHRAAAIGDTKAIEWIASEHPNQIDFPDRHGCTAIQYAAKSAHVSAIETLIRLGSKAIDAPDNQGWTPMRTAAHLRHEQVVEALVRLGSKAIDTPNKEGETPLLNAARFHYRGSLNLIKTLGRLGSQAFNTPSSDGSTPFHGAATSQPEVLKALVRLGSQPTDAPRCPDGYTPMQTAILCFNAKAIPILVQLGCNVDARSANGKTPLQLALDMGYAEGIEVLIEMGSKALYVLDKEGFSPFDRLLTNWFQATTSLETLLRLDCVDFERPIVASELRPEVRWLLKAAGFSNMQIAQQPDAVEPSEDEAAELRYRVYFSRSLTSRLLRHLSASKVLFKAARRLNDRGATRDLH